MIDKSGERKCVDCIYYLASEAEGWKWLRYPPGGICRCKASVFGSNQSECPPWPLVEETDWCGEFQDAVIITHGNHPLQREAKCIGPEEAPTHNTALLRAFIATSTPPSQKTSHSHK